MNTSLQKHYYSDRMIELFQSILTNTLKSTNLVPGEIVSLVKSKNIEILMLLMDSEYKLESNNTFIPNNICVNLLKFIDKKFKINKDPQLFDFNSNTILNTESEVTALFLLTLFYYSGNKKSEKQSKKVYTKTKRTPKHNPFDAMIIAKMQLFYYLFRDVLNLYMSKHQNRPTMHGVDEEKKVLLNFVRDLNLFLDTHNKRKMLQEVAAEVKKKIAQNQNRINKSILTMTESEKSGIGKSLRFNLEKSIEYEPGFGMLYDRTRRKRQEPVSALLQMQQNVAPLQDNGVNRVSKMPKVLNNTNTTQPNLTFSQTNSQNGPVHLPISSLRNNFNITTNHLLNSSRLNSERRHINSVSNFRPFENNFKSTSTFLPFENNPNYFEGEQLEKYFNFK